MKNILYIITIPSLEDISPAIFDQDSADVQMRVIFTQEGVRCSNLDSISCVALQEDVQTRNLKSVCPTISYSDMVQAIFESDLVITM